MCSAAPRTGAINRMHNTSPLYKNVTGTPRSPWADISILQMEKSFQCGTADR